MVQLNQNTIKNDLRIASVLLTNLRETLDNKVLTADEINNKVDYIISILSVYSTQENTYDPE